MKKTHFLGILSIVLAACLIYGCSATKSANTKDTRPFAEQYTDKSLQAFVLNPSSQTLNQVCCGMFNARESIMPETLMVRYLKQPEEYRTKVWLLIKNSAWFTDYTESPSFQWQEYTYSSNPELLKTGNWKMSRGADERIVAWDELVDIIMSQDQTTNSTI